MSDAEKTGSRYPAFYSLAFTAGNCVAAEMLGTMAGHMRDLYKADDIPPQAVLGIMPSLALDLPPWLWVVAALSLASGMALLARKLSVSRLMHLLLVIASIDCLVLFLFVLALWSHDFGMMEWVGFP